MVFGVRCTLYRRKYFHFFALAKRTNNKLRAEPPVTARTTYHHHCHHHSIITKARHVVDFYMYIVFIIMFCIWVSKFVPQYLGWYYFLIWVEVPDRHMRFIFFTLVHLFCFCYSLYAFWFWEFLPLCIRVEVYIYV